MPNICDFELKARGSEKNLLLFKEWLKAYYHYSELVFDETTKEHKYVPVPEPHVYKEDENDKTKKIPVEHHIGYRVFDFDVTDMEKIGDGKYLMSGYGNCAWSVYSCMFEGPFTYLSDREEDGIERKALPLVKACEMLELEVEIFSSESGMGFSEHYYIKNGELEDSEEVEFNEIWAECYDSYEDYLEDHKEDKKVWTKEEFESNPEPIIECEFFEKNCDCFAYKYM